jgi:transcriptional regulator with XRE-family HTH domain
MPRSPFSSFLERRYLEWQIEQGERISQAEFARLMGVSRASLTMWMNGTHLPDLESAKKIASVLGPEVFEILGLPRPNPYLQKINQVFERLSPEHQQKLAEDAERYEANNISKTPKPRKTSTR